jgi:predicted transcriptional regulator
MFTGVFFMPSKLVIRGLERPHSVGIDADIDWICESFGFFEDIDRDKTAAKIFRELIKSMAEGDGLTSTSLGSESNVTRGAALNHLKRMMAAGLVVRDGNRYLLRCSSLYRTMNEIHRDIDRMFEDIEGIAREIDARMGFGGR